MDLLNHQCVVCNRVHPQFQKENCWNDSNEIVRIYGVYSSYLKGDMFTKTKEWDSLSEDEKKSPFCDDCFSSGMKLCSLHDLLIDIKKKIDDFIQDFTLGILRYDCTEILQDQQFSELDGCFDTFGIQEDNYDVQEDDPEIKNVDLFWVGKETESNPKTELNLELLPCVKAEIPDLKPVYVHLERLPSNYCWRKLESQDRKRHRMRKVRCNAGNSSILPSTVSASERRRSKIRRKTLAESEGRRIDAKSVKRKKCSLKIKKSKKSKDVSNSRQPKEKNFQCIPCGMKFSTEEVLNIHISKHREKPYRCTVCGDNVGLTDNTRRKHYKEVHPGKKIKVSASKSGKCEVCGDESFSSRYDFEVHVLAHNEEIPFQCQVCFEKFSNAQSYRNHQEKSSCPVGYRGVSESHHCDVCGKTFKAMYQLLLHVSIEHNKLALGFECSVCQQKIMEMSKFRSHTVTHTEEFPISCDICGMPLRTHSYLSLHRLTHKSTGSFVCKICNSTFGSKSALVRHRETDHAELEQIWKCDTCGMQLKHKADLKRHVATHFKTFICDVCGKAFDRNVYLKTHYRIHTGEMFSCSTCEKKFVSQYLLNQHIASVHFNKTSKVDRVIKRRVKRHTNLNAENIEND